MLLFTFVCTYVGTNTVLLASFANVVNTKLSNFTSILFNSAVTIIIREFQSIFKSNSDIYVTH